MPSKPSRQARSPPLRPRSRPPQWPPRRPRMRSAFSPTAPPEIDRGNPIRSMFGEQWRQCRPPGGGARREVLGGKTHAPPLPGAWPSAHPTTSPPPRASATRPSEAELRALWRRHEAARAERERAARWRRASELLRRDPDGELRLAHGDMGGGEADADACGPRSRAALRPVPAAGPRPRGGHRHLVALLVRARPARRSPARCRPSPPRRAAAPSCCPSRSPATASAGSPTRASSSPRAARAARRCSPPPRSRPRWSASAPASPTSASVLPPGAAPACAASTSPPTCAPTPRLEGLALLECRRRRLLRRRQARRLPRRAPHRVASCSRARAGRTLARLYDKGAQTRRRRRAAGCASRPSGASRASAAPPPRASAPPSCASLFARRFAPLWQAAGGIRLAPGTGLVERIAEAVADGRLAPSRARTLAGYLLLSAAGVPQGARRTTYELERECRELGLLASLSADADRSVDVATVLDECMAPEVWDRPRRLERSARISTNGRATPRNHAHEGLVVTATQHSASRDFSPQGGIESPRSSVRWVRGPKVSAPPPATGHHQRTRRAVCTSDRASRSTGRWR